MATVSSPTGNNVLTSGTLISWSDFVRETYWNGAVKNCYIKVNGNGYSWQERLTYPSGGTDEASGSVILPTMPANTSMTVTNVYNWKDSGLVWHYNKTIVVSTFSTRSEPQAFNLLSPANNITGQSRRPTFSWQSSQYADGYKVFVGLSSSALSLKATITGTSYIPTESEQFDFSTKYYWKVQAYNSNGTTRDSSQVFCFTVMAEPLPPAKPDIVVPLNDAIDIPRSQQLQFKDGTGGDPATNYDIYFGTNAQNVTDADNTSGEFKTNQSHTGDSSSTQNYNPGSLGNNVDYYWRIDAKNAQGTAKGDTWHFKTIEVQLGSPIEKIYRKKLIALADDKFWYENQSNDLVSLGKLEIISGDGLDLTKPVSVVSAYQKVFIVNGSVKKVIDFSNTRLMVSNFSHIPARGAILSQANGSAMVIDYIDSQNKYIYGFVTNGTFQTSQTATVTEAGIGYDYSVTNVTQVTDTPLYYNWGIYPHDDDEGDKLINGRMPDEPTILALYRGRIVQSGDKNSPHVIYMSEQANPFNFSYGSDDSAAASAISSGYAGNIGDVVTAVVPYRDDYMIIGCSQTMWLMRGDPASGGSIDQISFTAGLFDKTSYAWDSQDNLYFLDSNGIYLIPAGFGAVKKLTQETLPDFAGDFALAPDVHRVTFAYDRKKHGILICKTDIDTGDNQNYWLDLRTSGFFSEQYPTSCSVYSASYYSADDPANRELLLGSRDGYIRVFDARLYKDQISDSYNSIESYILIGPGAIAAENMQGLLTQLLFVLSEESNQLDYEIYTANSAQKAIDFALDENQEPNFSGVITAGLSSVIRPRCRGAYLVLKLSNQTIDTSWAFENITGRITQVGVMR